MTPESHKALAQKFLQTENMYYVVVGDAATQLSALEKIGLGKPVLVEL
jgi:zinc protease